MIKTNTSLANEFRPRALSDVLGQARSVRSLTNFLRGHTSDGTVVKLPPVMLFAGVSGCGKCLGRGTPVLMFDGSVKAVEDVQVGDQLMGPDSGPRNVLSTCTGVEPLYKVVPIKGTPYVVNESHILSLKWGATSYRRYQEGDVINISVRDYLNETKSFRAYAKGYRVGLDFPSKHVPLDPYMLGAWLGDGNTGTARITTMDPEIFRYLQEFCDVNSVDVPEHFKLQLLPVQAKGAATTYAITTGRNGGMPTNNLMVAALKDLGVFMSKRVPDLYLRNSREVRLSVLAGLIDTDGTFNGCFNVIFKSEGLANDTVFLARSLGFAAYVHKVRKFCTYKGERREGDYYRISISGDLSEIPTKVKRKQAAPRRQSKNVLVTGIRLEPQGPGDYFGFEIDGDRLFLLGDLTVTHNTTLARIVAAAGTCQHFDPETCKPCGECGDCVAALTGSADGPNFMFLDGGGSKLKEVVEHDLTTFVHNSPFSRARKRFCIVDEAQELSIAAEAKLLTLCENLPSSSHIIFTTTDPEKMSMAIRGRCSPYYLQPLSNAELVEGVIRHRPELDEPEAREGLGILADFAGGSMRALWQLIEKWSSFDEPMTQDLAFIMAGGAAVSEREKLWGCVDTGDYAGVVDAWKTMLSAGAAPMPLAEQLCQDLFEQAALNPLSRDWTQPIKLMSQAIVMKAPQAVVAALLATTTSAAKSVSEATVAELASLVSQKLIAELGDELKAPIAEALAAMPDTTEVIKEFAGLVMDLVPQRVPVREDPDDVEAVPLVTTLGARLRYPEQEEQLEGEELQPADVDLTDLQSVFNFLMRPA